MAILHVLVIILLLVSTSALPLPQTHISGYVMLRAQLEPLFDLAEPASQSCHNCDDHPTNAFMKAQDYQGSDLIKGGLPNFASASACCQEYTRPHTCTSTRTHPAHARTHARKHPRAPTAVTSTLNHTHAYIPTFAICTTSQVPKETRLLLLDIRHGRSEEKLLLAQDPEWTHRPVPCGLSSCMQSGVQPVAAQSLRGRCQHAIQSLRRHCAVAVLSRVCAHARAHAHAQASTQAASNSHIRYNPGLHCDPGFFFYHKS